MDTQNNLNDTAAWIFQCWASFLLALGAMLTGITYLPANAWIKGFLATTTLFLVGASFTLAKTIRDNHESQRMLNRVKNAKTERLIREYEDVS